jgi:hypothetical protein
MSKIESPQDLFARLEDGKIVEYPVYRLHIQNRSHPIKWYTPVVEVNKPEVPDYHYLLPTLSVEDGVVKVTYEVKPYDLAQLLAKVNGFSMDMPGQKGVFINQIDPGLAAKIVELTSNYAEAKLEAFIATRGYDSLNNLLSRYKDSSVEKFKAEANHVQGLLDALWGRLMAYYGEINTGAKPIPKHLTEIDQVIGEFDWGNLA